MSPLHLSHNLTMTPEGFVDALSPNFCGGVSGDFEMVCLECRIPWNRLDSNVSKPQSENHDTGVTDNAKVCHLLKWPCVGGKNPKNGRLNFWVWLFVFGLRIAAIPFRIVVRKQQRWLKSKNLVMTKNFCSSVTDKNWCLQDIQTIFVPAIKGM